MTECIQKIGAKAEKVEQIGDSRWYTVKDPLIHHGLIAAEANVLAGRNVGINVSGCNSSKNVVVRGVKNESGWWKLGMRRVSNFRPVEEGCGCRKHGTRMQR